MKPWHEEAAEHLAYRERMHGQSVIPTRDSARMLAEALAERAELLKRPPAGLRFQIRASGPASFDVFVSDGAGRASVVTGDLDPAAVASVRFVLLEVRKAIESLPTTRKPSQLHGELLDAGGVKREYLWRVGAGGRLTPRASS
jgi:hypothetical protein